MIYLMLLFFVQGYVIALVLYNVYTIQQILLCCNIFFLIQIHLQFFYINNIFILLFLYVNLITTLLIFLSLNIFFVIIIILYNIYTQHVIYFLKAQYVVILNISFTYKLIALWKTL